MVEAIIDTNVAVIANGQNNDVVQSCYNACVRFIITAKASRVIVIDDGDEVRSEYAKAIADRRPHELGAHFLFHILNHQYDPAKVRRVALTKDGNGNFIDFPNVPELSTFNHSDRKFAALSKNTGIEVTHAADSDWCDFLTPLQANGINITHLCGADPTQWFKP